MLSPTGTIEKISAIAYSFKETVLNTYELTKRAMVNNIPGVFVECGVAAGAQIAAMQLANTEHRLIMAYDSFEGIPLAGVHDITQPGIGLPKHNVNTDIQERLVSSGISSHSVETVKNNLHRLSISTENIQFIKGWFQNTLPFNQIDSIALLRLDGDLYESTMVCLEYLYPKVSKGGFIIIDDYALPGARKAFQEYAKSNKIKPKLIKVPPEENGVVWFEKQ